MTLKLTQKFPLNTHFVLESVMILGNFQETLKFNIKIMTQGDMIPGTKSVHLRIKLVLCFLLLSANDLCDIT